ncbi:MAG: adenylate/guanylate cyclase domain-containing protein [Dehalococcoidia bacterium]|nr:adenylate/guanylate cyclase domain-containing protein [Dehalococcoidia bacterium]
MEQEIRFCTTPDGVRIAYALVGEGPPLVATPWSWQSIRFEMEDTYGGPFFQPLARRYKVIHYDRRGVGLSDRERVDFTTEADVRDLETVVDHLGLKRFALMGSFHLGPAAIAYSARHPRRVSRLILYGTYACGQELTRDEIKVSITAMMRSHWGMASRTLANLVAPGAEGEVLERIAHVYRESATGEMAARLLEMAYNTDVVGFLPGVKAPTLVLHRRETRAVPFRLCRELASLLPNARLETVEGTLYWPWLGDADSVVKAIFKFLEEEERVERPARRSRTRALEGLVTILFTDMEGSTAVTQRLGDAGAQEVLRTHNSIVREALKAHDGSEIKHTGDGVMASFSTASKALDCAVAVQRAFASRNDANPQEAIRVRVGLNVGEPVAEEHDLFGTAVQMAARIHDWCEWGITAALPYEPE